jgi:HEAT repeat protein
MNPSHTTLLSSALLLLLMAPGLAEAGEGVYRGRTVEQWCRQLNEGDAGAREQALRALEVLGVEAGAAVMDLVPLLHDPDVSIRMRVLRVLEQIGPGAQPAQPFLEMRIGGVKAPAELAAYLATLGRIDPRSFPGAPVIKALEANALPVDANLCAALQPLGASATPVLKHLLSHADGRVRLSAATLLWKLNSCNGASVIPVLLELQTAPVELRNRAAFVLRQMGTAAVLALTDALAAREPRLRSQAARILGEIGPDAVEATEALTRNLTHADVEVRLETALALWRVDRRQEPAVEVLTAAAKDSDVEVRRRAIAYLGWVGPGARSALPLLRESLQDAHLAVRIEAVFALSEVDRGQPAEMVPVLAEIIRSRDEQLFWQFVPLLRDLGHAAWDLAPVLIEEMHAARDGRFWRHLPEVLARIGPDTLTLMPAAITQASPEQCRQTQEAFLRTARLLGRRSVVALVSLLPHKDVRVRRLALQALYQAVSDLALSVSIPDLDTQDTVQALVARLRDCNAQVRALAVQTLGELGPTAAEALPALADLLNDEKLRQEAVQALGCLGAQALPLAPRLKELLDDDDLSFRLAVAQALWQTERQLATVTAVLGQVLVCSDPALCLRALATVTHMGPEAAGLVPYLLDPLRARGDRAGELVQAAGAALAAVGPEAVPALIKASADPDSRFRLAVVRLLGAIRTPRADVVQALDRALGDADRRVRLQAAVLLCQLGQPSAEALAELSAALRRADLRPQAIAFLGDIGAQAAAVVPVLVEVLEDPAVTVRDDLWIPAVARVGPAAHRAVPLLVDRLREADHALYAVHAATVEALVQIGPRAVPALTDALERRHPRVRAGAAAALGRIGPEARRAIPALVRRLGDAEVAVRQSAVTALGSIEPAAALTELTGALRDADPAVRRAAVLALAPLRQAPVRELLEMVRDSDASVSATILEAAGQHPGGPRWRWYQQAFARSRHGRVRAEALRHWAAARAEEGAAGGLDTALADALKDRDYRIREMAALLRPLPARPAEIGE